jgi:ACR3 family arsenite efflux pump ArsB
MTLAVTIPLEAPATLMFEVVVTLGVSTWAWSLAAASRRSETWWAVLTCAGSFLVHRACAWVVGVTSDPNDVFSSGGQVWRMAGPFLGSIVVFVVAPVVLGMVIRERLPQRRGGSASRR